jgi:deoxyribose-phosphate aldolase
MLKINNYLDSTYLKTAKQAGISQDETKKNVVALIDEAIKHDFVLVMLRPKFVELAKKTIAKANSKVTVGTVIGFHEGTNSINEKLTEAKTAISNQVDDLDFVINYNAFKNNEIDLVKQEVLKCTKLGIQNKKIVKWIIEIAALTDREIIEITELIKDVVVRNFAKNEVKNVFVKSSTGFYKTQNGKPAGATFKAMKLIAKHAKPLSIKAAGGVKNYNDAVKMINIGVTRIGTSSALAILQGKKRVKDY